MSIYTLIDGTSNCRADRQDAETAMELSDAKHVTIIKGWFDQTLDRYPADKPIALMRLDVDWYDSTMTCLQKLFSKVAVGGMIILDDYHNWDGCARAIHDYLSAEKRAERLDRFLNDVVFMIKTEDRATSERTNEVVQTT